MIWCVFDRDDNTNAMLSKAKQMAIKEGYQIAFSNPSFEVWFLLHFNNQTTPVENCEAAIKRLKKKGRLEQYEKNKEVYEQLKPLQEAAIDRAKKRVAVQYEVPDTNVLARRIFIRIRGKYYGKVEIICGKLR